MGLRTILFFIVVLSENSVFSLSDGGKNTSSSDLAMLNKTMCTEKNCLMKCCPEGKFLKATRYTRQCIDYNSSKDIKENFRKDILLFGNANLSSFLIKAGVFEANETFMNDSVNAANLQDFNVYLTENAEVVLELPNAYDRWTHVPNDKFCLDYRIGRDRATKKITIEPGIWIVINNPSGPSRTSFILMTTAMLISCFFLLLVLVVYTLLRELRNLCGLILMAYVASLLAAFLLLAVMRIDQHEDTMCIGLTLMIYFFFLASFCWMHVMSYDIWWTFRGYAKARPIHRRGETFKFIMYCLYAWGLPLIMTIMLGYLNNRKLSHIPWFVTPKIPTNGCFIEEGEKLLYLYIPMLILILCNWIFYVMTAFNVWRLSRGTAVLDSAAAGTPQAHRTHRHRFMVYLKLSVVMGLNWVLEVVSYLFPDSDMWYISDFYNILVGVSIFLIFVWKPKILRKLMKLFLRCKKMQWKPGQMDSTRSSSSTADSNSSQETQTLQVCANPKGPGYVMKNL